MFVDESICEQDQRCKIEFKKSLALTCGEAWVNIPSHLETMNGSRMFAAKLDIDGLSPGAHFTEVRQLFLLFTFSNVGLHVHAQQ